MRISAIATPLDMPRDAAGLEALLARHPHHCDLWHARALVHRQEGTFALAIEAVTRAITLGYLYHPLIHFESSALWWLAARHAHRLDEAERAIAACDAAIFQDHRNAAALILRQHYALQRGETLLAERHGRTLANLPTADDYAEALPTFAQWDEAITLGRAAPTHPPLLEAYQQHDAAYFQQNHAAMEAAAAALPDHPLPTRHLAEWHFNDAETCESWLQDGLARLKRWHARYHQEAALHHALRAELFEATGEAELARNDWRKCWDLDAENEAAKRQLG